MSPEVGRARASSWRSIPGGDPGVANCNLVKAAVNAVPQAPRARGADAGLPGAGQGEGLAQRGAQGPARPRVNEGFSGGEKKRNEIFQMAMSSQARRPHGPIRPDIDALRSWPAASTRSPRRRRHGRLTLPAAARYIADRARALRRQDRGPSGDKTWRSELESAATARPRPRPRRPPPRPPPSARGPERDAMDVIWPLRPRYRRPCRPRAARTSSPRRRGASSGFAALGSRPTDGDLARHPAVAPIPRAFEPARAPRPPLPGRPSSGWSPRLRELAGRCGSSSTATSTRRSLGGRGCPGPWRRPACPAPGARADPVQALPGRRPGTATGLRLAQRRVLPRRRLRAGARPHGPRAARPPRLRRGPGRAPGRGHAAQRGAAGRGGEGHPGRDLRRPARRLLHRRAHADPAGRGRQPRALPARARGRPGPPRWPHLGRAGPGQRYRSFSVPTAGRSPGTTWTSGSPGRAPPARSTACRWPAGRSSSTTTPSWTTRRRAAPARSSTRASSTARPVRCSRAGCWCARAPRRPTPGSPTATCCRAVGQATKPQLGDPRRRVQCTPRRGGGQHDREAALLPRARGWARARRGAAHEASPARCSADALPR
jgi:hypothetical protein